MKNKFILILIVITALFLISCQQNAENSNSLTSVHADTTFTGSPGAPNSSIRIVHKSKSKLKYTEYYSWNENGYKNTRLEFFNTEGDEIKQIDRFYVEDELQCRYTWYDAIPNIDLQNHLFTIDSIYNIKTNTITEIEYTYYLYDTPEISYTINYDEESQLSYELISLRTESKWYKKQNNSYHKMYTDRTNSKWYSISKNEYDAAYSMMLQLQDYCEAKIDELGSSISENSLLTRI